MGLCGGVGVRLHSGSVFTQTFSCSFNHDDLTPCPQPAHQAARQRHSRERLQHTRLASTLVTNHHDRWCLNVPFLLQQRADPVNHIEQRPDGSGVRILVRGGLGATPGSLRGGGGGDRDRHGVSNKDCFCKIRSIVAAKSTRSQSIHFHVALVSCVGSAGRVDNLVSCLQGFYPT